jgi:hypothetical protein
MSLSARQHINVEAEFSMVINGNSYGDKIDLDFRPS